MNIELLADNLLAVDKVAEWYFDEWSSSSSLSVLDTIRLNVSKSTSRTSAPMIVLAKENDEVVGAAELKLHEMDVYPEYEFWLGGVYVDKKFRSKGVGSLLVSEVISRSKKAGVNNLYLQTEDFSGGLYGKHGFKPLTKTNYNGRNVLVMVANIVA